MRMEVCERPKWGWIITSVVIGAAIGGYLWVRHQKQEKAAKPFELKMSEYCGTPWEKTKRTPYINMKAVVVDKAQKKVDDAFFDLDEKIRASNPKECATVVLCNYERSYVGAYSDGSHGYRTDCKVEIVDLIAKKVIHEESFRGDDPPSLKSTSGDFIASKPTGKVVEFLNKLPRK